MRVRKAPKVGVVRVNYYLVRETIQPNQVYLKSRYPQEARDAEGRSLRYQDMEDVWVIPREYWNGDLKTPTKLPAELVRKILQYSSVEGDLVLDPFLGSGQVAVIAQQMGRQYIGFEIVPEYYEFIQRQLREGVYRVKASQGDELSLPLN